jgi:AcrR family transcriptional regulator
MASDPANPPSSQPRGGDHVKAALIEAAAERLGEVGPKNLSVRDVAARAGVNHGQVHHYFGGKRGLLEAAIRSLAKAHYERSLALAGGRAIPRALSLTEDRPYFRALCQAVMDDDLALVTGVDRDEEISVPLRVLGALRDRYPDRDDLQIRVRFAAMAAMQLGWVAFDKLLLESAEVAPEEAEIFEQSLRDAMERMFDQAFEELEAVPLAPRSARTPPQV